MQGRGVGVHREDAASRGGVATADPRGSAEPKRKGRRSGGMLVSPSRIWRLTKTAIGAWWVDDAMSRGAAISFYTLFSLAPTLLLVIGVAGLAFGHKAAQGAVVDQFSGLIGQGGATAVQSMIQSAGDVGSGIVATTTGALTMLVFATGVFVELQNALNAIWKAQTSAGSGFVMFVRTRLIGFGLILAIGFVLMVSLALNAAFSAVGAHLAASLPAFEIALHAANVALSLAVTVLILAAIYKFMPDATVAWDDAWVGAAVTAVLLAIGKFAIGFYIGRAHLASSYGGASALITILLWVYYSSLIVLFGAELTKARAGEKDGGGAA